MVERDGLGWEFYDAAGDLRWEVFRHDGNAFPVFTCTCGDTRPEAADLLAMTSSAVADLMTSVGVHDPVGWLGDNIAHALVTAGAEVRTWDGLEWATESGSHDQAVSWATVAAARRPFAWLRADTASGPIVVETYQDDGVFGLSFVGAQDRELPPASEGSVRPCSSMSILVGAIERVDVVLDTAVEDASGPGVLSEVVLHGAHQTVMLLAAEAYSADEWHLSDESVVVLPDAAAADQLAWIPARTPWCV